ncbi:MAG: hypothetical protein J6Y97_09440 [Prevotella sp.]|nr:hypothetical protein [Prevotella sp.]
MRSVTFCTLDIYYSTPTTPYIIGECHSDLLIPLMAFLMGGTSRQADFSCAITIGNRWMST